MTFQTLVLDKVDIFVFKSKILTCQCIEIWVKLVTTPNHILRMMKLIIFSCHVGYMCDGGCY